MIALPAIAKKGGVIFAAGLLLGALASWGPASCVGKSQASQEAALKNQATAAKLEETAALMDRAAMLTEMTLAARTTAEVKELREIVRVEANQDAAGPGVDAVMQRLRTRAAR